MKPYFNVTLPLGTQKVIALLKTKAKKTAVAAENNIYSTV